MNWTDWLTGPVEGQSSESCSLRKVRPWKTTVKDCNLYCCVTIIIIIIIFHSFSHQLAIRWCVFQSGNATTIIRQTCPASIAPCSTEDQLVGMGRVGYRGVSCVPCPPCRWSTLFNRPTQLRAPVTNINLSTGCHSFVNLLQSHTSLGRPVR